MWVLGPNLATDGSYLIAFVIASALYWGRVVIALINREQNKVYLMYCALIILFPILLCWFSLAEFGLLEILGM